MEELEKNGKKEPVTLLDLIGVLYKNRWFIIIPTLISMFLIVVINIVAMKMPVEKSFMPNTYTPYADILISESDNQNKFFTGNGLAGVAGLAGVNIKNASANAELAAYLVSSKSFLDSVIQEFGLIERYKVQNSVKTNSRIELSKRLKTSYDEDSGIFRITYTDVDPVFAQSVINYVVSALEQRFLEMGIDENKLTSKNLEENIQSAYDKILELQNQIKQLEFSVSNVYSSATTPSITMDSSLLKMELTVQEQLYVELKAQYEKLRVTMESEKPVFEILEYAEVLDRKSAPARGKICIIVSILSFCFFTFLVFLKDIYEDVKRNPKLRNKLKGIK